MPLRGRPAFTLVELLVVLGIITVLIAVLLPTISRAREQAKSTVCLSNLRQLAVLTGAYAADHDGRYPIATYTVQTATVRTTFNWDFTVVKQKGGPATVKPGLIWRGADGGEAVQQCPSFEGASNSGGDPYTGYNYNTSYVGHGQYEANPAPARVAEVRAPAECVLFGDGGYVAGANKFMRAPFPNPGDATFAGRHAGTQAFRHAGRTNAVFADGHAESLKESFAVGPDGANVAAGTGFLSADNEMYDLD